MPRYFFHVVDGGSGASDEDGLDLPSLEAARDLAVRGARDIMASEVQQGSLNLGWRIDVTDEAGAPVLSVPFSEAVQLSGRRP